MIYLSPPRKWNNPRKWNHPRKLLFIIVALSFASLAGCNMPSDEAGTPTLNVTQAYQTVAARLTQAIAQTPSPAITPSATPGDSVETSPPATVEPSRTPTTQGPTSTGAGATCDQAAFTSDVTVPDGTEMLPGQEFTKIWRLQNAGSCTWTSDYDLVHFSGDQLGAPASVPLSAQVSAGQTVDLSVDMQAPDQPGTYRANWKLRNDSGALFGIGPSGGSAFWVEIEVVQPSPGTGSPTPSLTTTPTPTPTVAVQVRGAASMTPGDRLDLDSNQVNPGSGEDLALEAGDDNHTLAPLSGAALAVMGSSQPTLQDCQGATLSADPVNVEDSLVSGVYLCYRTDLALPGWAQVGGFDPDTATLSLDIFTWALP